MPPSYARTPGLARWRDLVPFLAGGHKGALARRLARHRARTRWEEVAQGADARHEAFALWLAAPPATAAALLQDPRYVETLRHAVVHQGPLAHATGELDGWWASQMSEVQIAKLAQLDAFGPTLDPLRWLAARVAWTFPNQAPNALWNSLCAGRVPPLDTAAWLAVHGPNDVAGCALDVLVESCPLDANGGRDGSILDDPDLLFGSPRLWCALGASGVTFTRDATIRMGIALHTSPWFKAGLFSHGGHNALRRMALFAARDARGWLEAFGPEDAGVVGPDPDLHAKMSALLLEAFGPAPHIPSRNPTPEAAPCAP